MSILPTKILLATDGSEDAQLAATTALDLSNRLNSQLHVLYVGHLPSVLYESPGALMLDPGFESRMRERAQEDAKSKLEEQVQKIKQAGGQVEGSHLRVGRPDAEIVAQAEEMGAGLIVMGSRGFGAIRRALTGSVSDSVVRHAHCPVMVVRGEPVVFPTKILFATDASREAELAATTAAELVKATASELQAVHVNPQYVYARAVRTAETEEVARKVLEEQVDHLRKEDVDVAEAHLRVGQPAAVIVALAEDMAAGLIVVGSRGLGAISRALIGSVSDAVVRHAHCSVMVVRPEK